VERNVEPCTFVNDTRNRGTHSTSLTREPNAGILAESEKRLKSNVIPKAISRKAWSEVTTELSRQLYSMRKAMNSVGGDAAAAKTFYQDIEALNLACLRKKQDVAQAAYEKSVADFDKFKSSI